MKTGTVDTLATHVANGMISVDVLIERADEPSSPGGVDVTTEEYAQIKKAWRQFKPGAGALTQTVEISCTALSSARGVYSDGFIRKVSPIRRGAVIVDLYPEDPEPEPQDLKAA